MAFPPVRTLIGIPYAATASVVSGADYSAVYWPVSQLVDGFGKTAWRCANTTGAVQLDLGSARSINFIAIFGHNFDPDMVVGITTSAFTRGCGVKQPAFWLDARALDGNPTTTQLVTVAWAGNSRPVTISEICVGLASEFNGTLDPNPTEQITFPQMRSKLEYGRQIVSASGALLRTMDLTLTLTPTDRVAFDAIHTAAAASPVAYPGVGTRVVVIPSSHRNDAWYVEWPGYVEQHFERSDRVVSMDLPLVEEAFGVS